MIATVGMKSYCISRVRATRIVSSPNRWQRVEGEGKQSSTSSIFFVQTLVLVVCAGEFSADEEIF